MNKVQVKTNTGETISINNNSLDQFKNDFHGELLLNGDPGYDEACSIWNAMIERKPALIARCLGVADVIKGVKFANEKNLTLSIKGGGHNISGLAVCDGGMMLDLSLMRGVWVDKTTRIARAQAGCLLGDVDRETQLHGLAAVLGFVSETGIAGLTIGGGFGYLTRQFGWTSDNVRSLEVVTTDGQVVNANEHENKDLFWALRGGGGNFGVVTGFDYKLFPVGPQVMAGAIAWRAEFADEVIKMFQNITEQAPPELVCVLGLRIAPPAPWISKEAHGKPIIALFVCHTGSINDGNKLVNQIKKLGSPIGDIIQPRSYVSQQSLLDATQPAGRRYYWKSEYLPKLDSEMLAKTIKHAKTITSPHSAILLFPIDGALNRLSEEHSAVGNRDANWVLNISASWEDAGDDKKNIGWAREAWQDMRHFSTGGTYINFLTEEEDDERIHDAYRKNYDQLVKVKKKWDPKNMFRMNKNIKPTA